MAARLQVLYVYDRGRASPEEGSGEKSSLSSATTVFQPPNSRWKIVGGTEKPPFVYRLVWTPDPTQSSWIGSGVQTGID